MTNKSWKELKARIELEKEIRLAVYNNMISHIAQKEYKELNSTEKLNLFSLMRKCNQMENKYSA